MSDLSAPELNALLGLANGVARSFAHDPAKLLDPMFLARYGEKVVSLFARSDLDDEGRRTLAQVALGELVDEFGGQP